jgi:hypothetical protein
MECFLLSVISILHTALFLCSVLFFFFGILDYGVNPSLVFFFKMQHIALYHYIVISICGAQ